MTTEQHLIISTESMRRSDAVSTGTDIVEVAELSTDEVAELSPDTTVAPVFPLVLAEPKPTEEDGPAFVDTAGGKAAWGIHAVGATASSYRGHGVRVAVIDTGIDADHPAFEGINLIQQDFVSANSTPGLAPDQQGHGTHCAGTIFGRDVDGIRIGVAPGITDAIVGKVFAPGIAASTLNLAAAINWAVRERADVISMSLGMDFPGYVQQLVDNFGYDIRAATAKALQGYSDNVMFFSRLADSLRSAQAFGQPVTIVAASGNESERTATSPLVLDAAPPSSAEGVYAVGALARTDGGYAVAPFSNARPSISAPGVNTLSAAMGGGLKPLSGTSMATPHVAGLLALHIEKLRAANGGDIQAGEQAMGDLLATTDTAALATGWNRRDYGAGLAQAPVS